MSDLTVIEDIEASENDELSNIVDLRSEVFIELGVAQNVEIEYSTQNFDPINVVREMVPTQFD